MDNNGKINGMSYKEIVENQIAQWITCVRFTDFYEEIEKRIIGQPNLKLVIADIYSYLSGIVFGNPANCNMILSAPSGTGKTETYRAIREYFLKEIPSLPIYIFDITAVTSNGFKGLDAANILTPLFSLHINRPYGIVFLDEFDKRMVPLTDARGENMNRDVQSSLLTIVEGNEVQVRGGMIDTSNLMFVGLGSFDSFREEKKDVRRPVGIGMDWSYVEDTRDHYKALTREDMVSAGASNELIGRFPYIVNYERLSDAAITSIIDKTTQEVAEEYNLTELILGKAMYDVLYECANTKFGCRLIASKLKEATLTGYADAMEKAPDFYNTTNDYGLVITIESPEDIKAEWEILDDNPLCS
ncbi:MAG: AAA family ATPase [Lachnospiraceae bacterium]|nr:AAA family ATPase [Lachnospiraceae bacterium]